MQNVRILHADSQPLTREGLRSVLMRGGGIDLFEQVASDQELINKITVHDPNLIIVDYNQPNYFSLSGLKHIRQNHPEVRVLVISSDNNQTTIMQALEMGVDGYLTRQCDEGEILNAIFAINKGEKFYCNKIINILMDRSLSPEDVESCEPTSLSERETEITRMIASGMTNKQIAETLFISIHTVNTHRKNIMRKLGVNSASALVLYAVNAGLVGADA